MKPRLVPLLSLSIFLLSVGAAVLPGRADTPKKPELDPNLPYQAKRSNPVTYEVDFRAVVTAPYHTKRLRVWLPLPQSDAAQEVVEGTITAFPVKVQPKVGSEKKFGNKFAYFEFDHPEGAQIIQHTFKVRAWELNWNIEPSNVQAVKSWPNGFDSYLKSDATVVVDDRFERLSHQIVPTRKNAADDLAAVMDWLQENMKYDHGKASLKASSANALQHKAGHCSDFHGLCAAFGRALGYPTRVTYGINPFPKNSPSHCKIEAFLPPYGWVSFDVSETQKLVGKIQKARELTDVQKRELVKAATDRLRRGFRDNTWFLQTRGTDYELAPPAGKRVPLVRTIYAEADGVALPDPDPALAKKMEFSWMTVHHYTSDKDVSFPFSDWKSLEVKTARD
jgi:transglutaminase-like putative cysteine protease